MFYVYFLQAKNNCVQVHCTGEDNCLVGTTGYMLFYAVTLQRGREGTVARNLIIGKRFERNHFVGRKLLVDAADAILGHGQ